MLVQHLRGFWLGGNINYSVYGTNATLHQSLPVNTKGQGQTKSFRMKHCLGMHQMLCMNMYIYVLVHYALVNNTPHYPTPVLYRGIDR